MMDRGQGTGNRGQGTGNRIVRCSLLAAHCSLLIVRCSLLILMLPTILFAADSKPMALLFPVIAGEGADADLAVEATNAIKTYLRQTGKADITDFDKDSPLIGRALLEHSITSEQLGEVSTPDSRLKMGKLVGADLVVSGDVIVQDESVGVSIWLAETRSRKIWRNESAVRIASVGNIKRARSNALQSATSTVIYQLAEDALKGVKVDETSIEPDSGRTDNGQLIAPDLGTAPVSNEAGTHLSSAEKFAKDGDVASAIQEYRLAINSDPNNIDIRLKLIRLYTKRKLYTQAVDEVERAQAIAPDNDDLRAELARIYEEKGESDKAAQIYDSRASENPKDLAPRLKAGDYRWQHNMLEDAEKQYRLAVEVDPSSPIPHERLVVLLATQSFFNESRKELDELAKLETNPNPKNVAARYKQLWGIAQRDIQALLAQYDKSATQFAQKGLTRESYYDVIRSVGIRIDSIGNFLQGITPPESDSSAHRRHILGCSLLSQASEHMLGYLETNKTSEKDDAAIFLDEAKKHLNAS